MPADWHQAWDRVRAETGSWASASGIVGHDDDTERTNDRVPSDYISAPCKAERGETPRDDLTRVQNMHIANKKR